MRQIVRCTLVPLVALAAALWPQTARADEVKFKVFLFGRMWALTEAEAHWRRGQPTDKNLQAVAAIKEGLKLSIKEGKGLKVGTATLEEFLKKVDGLSFDQIADRLVGLREETIKALDRDVHQGAGAYFILAGWQYGTEDVAQRVMKFARKDRPGSAVLIRRNTLWLQTALKKTAFGLSAAPVDKLLEQVDGNATFAALRKQAGEIYSVWFGELLKAPPFPPVKGAMGTTPGGSSESASSQAGTQPWGSGQAVTSATRGHGRKQPQAS